MKIKIKAKRWWSWKERKEAKAAEKMLNYYNDLTVCYYCGDKTAVKVPYGPNLIWSCKTCAEGREQ